MKRIPRLRLAFLLIVAMLLAALAGLCTAEEGTPPAMIKLPPNYRYDESKFQILLYESSEYVPGLKKALANGGYYPETNDLSVVLEHKYLDDVTMMAVSNFCDANPGTEYDEYGVLASTYWAIMEHKEEEPDATTLQDGDAPVYEHINWNDKGEGVRHVQERLHELGFLDTYEIDDTGRNIYDVKTQEALDVLLNAYGIGNYDQNKNNGITADLQAQLDSLTPIATPDPSAEPAPEATPKPPIGKRLRNYWFDNTNLLGLSLPNFVMWLIGLALVILIILAVIHFFVPSPDGDKPRRRPSTHQLSFEITYDGHTEEFSCTVHKILRIGRNVGSFPLNPEDSNISRRHCEIYYVDDDLMLRDYSSNGTTVNGRIVHDTTCKLNSGDTLVIGEHSILLKY